MTIAIRTLENGTDMLNWVLGDHLGSTSTTANVDGSLNSVIQYTAYGEIRLTQGVTPTKYRYTGQLAQAELGLDYYVARWYDPMLGHFTQADSIVPEPGKTESYDRYAYVENNPFLYVDPSGHDAGCGGYECSEYALKQIEKKHRLLKGIESNDVNNSTIRSDQPSIPLLGFGFQQSIETRIFHQDLLLGEYIEGGYTTTNSLSTAGKISLLIEVDDMMNITGIEFDTENFFGGYSPKEGLMVGGRTPGMNELVNINNKDTDLHIAGSFSMNYPENNYEPEITMTLYYPDVTTGYGNVINGETMHGYYLTGKISKTLTITTVGIISLYAFSIESIALISYCASSNICTSVLD